MIYIYTHIDMEIRKKSCPKALPYNENGVKKLKEITADRLTLCKRVANEVSSAVENMIKEK